MLAACPFPANHGSAGSIREMSDTLSDMGHNVHIVTYPTGQELNYMVAGKPVVSFAGSAKGVNHLHDVFIISNLDCEALGRGIVTLLNDRKLAAELGVNARATVLANFDWRHICAKIERIYQRLLGEPESRDIRSEHDALARSQP
jgi:glycosyltransferase involved in cell wall biosynthesis